MPRYENFPASSRAGAGSSPSADTYVTIDETNAGAAIKITGRAFVNAANDTWSGVTVTRWNRSRFIRVTGYVDSSITFLAQACPGGSGKIAVLVDGTIVTTVQVSTASASPAYYTASGLGLGSKTVELIEDFQERLTELDTGLDGRAAGTYVLQVVLPAGVGSITKPTATTGIATFGNSHVDGDATDPCSYYGWAGQLRRVANSAGTTIVGYVGAGSSTLCGDGFTAAQAATMISDLWSQMGCSTKKLLLMHGRNDYAYYNFAGSVQTSAAQYQTFLEAIQTALDVSDAGWTGIYTRIPQGSAWGSIGGRTLDDFWNATVSASTSGGRSNVTTHDYTDFTSAGLSLANPSHFFEANPNQVHLAQAGHNIVFGVVRGWYSL